MKPILKYPGAKWRLASWIMDNMPPHESYVEPYFGSGAIFFNKLKSRIETINDIDGEVIQFFRVCREHPQELAYLLSVTPYAREEFRQSKEPCEDELEMARRFALRCWMTFGARRRSNTWRYATGANAAGGPDNPKLWRRLPELVCTVAERLMDAQIECRPALDIIRHFNGPEVLLYADPPYLLSTRTLHGSQYLHEMTEQDHAELLETLREYKGMVMLSGYDSELYRRMLYDWQCCEINAVAERGARRRECLWLNPAAVKGRVGGA